MMWDGVGLVWDWCGTGVGFDGVGLVCGVGLVGFDGVGLVGFKSRANAFLLT